MKRPVFLSVTKGKQTKVASALPVPQTQSDIDKRDAKRPAEREITRRLQAIGVR